MANLQELDAADGHGNLAFHDFFPLMAQKLGDRGLMQELAKGFQMLADPSTQTITVHSLRRCASSLGLSHFSDQDLLEMFQLGDASGSGELDLHQFCVAMVRSSPDLMEEALRVILDDGYEAEETKDGDCVGSNAKESNGNSGDGHRTKLNDFCSSSDSIEADTRNFTGSEAQERNFTVSEAEDRKFTVSGAEEEKFAGSKAVEAKNGIAFCNSELEHEDREQDFNLSVNPRQKQRDAVILVKAKAFESSSTRKLVDDAFPDKDQTDTIFHGNDHTKSFISVKEEGDRSFSCREADRPFLYKDQGNTSFPYKDQAPPNPKKRKLSDEAYQKRKHMILLANGVPMTQKP